MPASCGHSLLRKCTRVLRASALNCEGIHQSPHRFSETRYVTGAIKRSVRYGHDTHLAQYLDASARRSFVRLMDSRVWAGANEASCCGSRGWPGLGLGRLPLTHRIHHDSPFSQRTAWSLRLDAHKYPTLKSLRNFDGDQLVELRRRRCHGTRAIGSPRSPYASFVSMELWIYAGGLWSRAIAYAGSSFRPSTILTSPPHIAPHTSYPHHRLGHVY